MKKRRKTITPDIGIIADGKIFPLVKDELAKSVMRPMSDEEKDEFYPQLDGQPLKQSINDLGLCKYLDVLPLTTPDLKQEKKRILMPHLLLTSGRHVPFCAHVRNFWRTQRPAIFVFFSAFLRVSFRTFQPPSCASPSLSTAAISMSHRSFCESSCPPSMVLFAFLGLASRFLGHRVSLPIGFLGGTVFRLRRRITSAGI